MGWASYFEDIALRSTEAGFSGGWGELDYAEDDDSHPGTGHLTTRNALPARQLVSGESRIAVKRREKARKRRAKAKERHAKKANGRGLVLEILSSLTKDGRFVPLSCLSQAIVERDPAFFSGKYGYWRFGTMRKQMQSKGLAEFFDDDTCCLPLAKGHRLVMVILLRMLAKDESAISIPCLNEAILKRHPKFHAHEYGYKRFRVMLEDMQAHGLVQLFDGGTCRPARLWKGKLFREKR